MWILHKAGRGKAYNLDKFDILKMDENYIELSGNGHSYRFRYETTEEARKVFDHLLRSIKNREALVHI